MDPSSVAVVVITVAAAVALVAASLFFYRLGQAVGAKKNNTSVHDADTLLTSLHKRLPKHSARRDPLAHGGLPRTPKRPQPPIRQRVDAAVRRLMGSEPRNTERHGVPLAAAPAPGDVEGAWDDVLADEFDETRMLRAEDVLLREMQTGDVGRVAMALREAIQHGVKDEYVWAGRVLVERLTSAFLGLDATRMSAKQQAAATVRGYYGKGEEPTAERMGSPGLFLSANGDDEDEERDDDDYDDDDDDEGAEVVEDGGNKKIGAQPSPNQPPPSRGPHKLRQRRRRKVARTTLEGRFGVHVDDVKRRAKEVEMEEAVALVLDLGPASSHAHSEADRSGYQGVTRRALSRATGMGVDRSWHELRMPGGHVRYYNTLTGAITSERPVHLEEGGASTQARLIETTHKEMASARQQQDVLEELLKDERLKCAELQRTLDQATGESPRQPKSPSSGNKEYVVPWGIMAACISDNFAGIFKPARISRKVQSWATVAPILREVCKELQTNLHMSVYFALPVDPPILGKDRNGKLVYVAATESDRWLEGTVLPDRTCTTTYQAARSGKAVIVDDIFATSVPLHIWRRTGTAAAAASPNPRSNFSESPEIMLRAVSQAGASVHADILEIGGRQTSMSVIEDRERIAAMRQYMAENGTSTPYYDDGEEDGEEDEEGNLFERPVSARIAGSRGISATGQPLSSYATGAFGAFPITLGGGEDDPPCGTIGVDTLRRVEAHTLSDEEVDLLHAIARAVGQLLRYAWERERADLFREMDETLISLNREQPNEWHDGVAQRVVLDRLRARLESYFRPGAVGVKRMLSTMRLSIETPLPALGVLASVMLLLGADGVYDALQSARTATTQLDGEDAYERFLPGDAEVLRVLWRHHILNGFDRAHEQMHMLLRGWRWTACSPQYIKLAERIMQDVDPSSLVEPSGILLVLYYWCRMAKRVWALDSTLQDKLEQRGKTKGGELDAFVNKKHTKKTAKIMERVEAHRRSLAAEARVRRSKEQAAAVADAPRSPGGGGAVV